MNDNTLPNYQKKSTKNSNGSKALSPGSSHEDLIEILHSKAILENFDKSDFSNGPMQMNNAKLHVKKDKSLYFGVKNEFWKPAFFMAAWFLCSFMTIMLNKYILTSLDTDPGILGEFQIVMTTVFGLIVMYLPFDILKFHRVPPSGYDYNRAAFFKSMLILGFLR